MRRTTHLIFAGLIAFSATLGLASVANAQEAAMTSEQQDRIRLNCTEIKASVNQLHASDALLRVNRGQVYESLASRLMDRFNARLNSSRLDAKAMETVTTKYRSNLAEFRSHYILYEQKLSAAMKIDCAKEPARFYTTVQQAREYRAKVHEDVQLLHSSVDDYRNSVNDFLLNYERVAK